VAVVLAGRGRTSRLCPPCDGQGDGKHPRTPAAEGTASARSCRHPQAVSFSFSRAARSAREKQRHGAGFRRSFTGLIGCTARSAAQRPATCLRRTARSERECFQPHITAAPFYCDAETLRPNSGQLTRIPSIHSNLRLDPSSFAKVPILLATTVCPSGEHQNNRLYPVQLPALC
jgi:hypothetical protein